MMFLMQKLRVSVLRACVFALALSFAVLMPLTAAITEPVHIDTGSVASAAGINPDVRVFEGIPYAAPPVGNLRWHAPKPAAKWDGVRESKFAANCMQRAANGGGFPAEWRISVPNRGMSEDCLVPQRLHGEREVR